MKVLINSDYGGFGLSDEAWELYLNKKNLPFFKSKSSFNTTWYSKDEKGEEIYLEWDLDRTDSDLISIVEKLGDKANSWASSLKIIEIPDDVEWYIEEHDGREWVAEQHRKWN